MNPTPDPRDGQVHAPASPTLSTHEGHIRALQDQPRLAYRKADLSVALGISTRALEREIAAGRFPKPDRVVGRMPLWADSNVRRWLEGGAK